MPKKKDTPENRLVIAPSLIDENKWFVFRESGEEVEVWFANGKQHENKPLQLYEKRYFKKLWEIYKQDYNQNKKEWKQQH